MKVALGSRPYYGPWGGGNRFVRALHDALKEAGHCVVHNLAQKDIDIVLLTEPRTRSPNVCFGAGAIQRYLMGHNPGPIVVHRINECDERKGTRHMNALLRRANYVADHTVFIATWLRDLDLWARQGESSVILNGADTAIFHPGPTPPWNGLEPLRLVTHHWGGNRMKGFDVYEAIDRMLDAPAWRERLAFTYIGNLPDGFGFANARYLMPLEGRALAEELARHHVYVTGSINEPAGMHHIEGALCGLPLLYRKSGALPEYCDGFGVGFDGAGFEAALRRLMADYAQWKARMPHYRNTADRMCRGYLDLFADLLMRREEILARRQLWRDPWLVVRNQIPL
jgi:hypothetical protein